MRLRYVQGSRELLSRLVAEEGEASALLVCSGNVDSWPWYYRKCFNCDVHGKQPGTVVLRRLGCSLLGLVTIAHAACRAAFNTGRLFLVAFNVSNSIWFRESAAPFRDTVSRLAQRTRTTPCDMALRRVRVTSYEERESA